MSENILPRARRNQLANIKNPWQGDTVKALCVCSAGLLRSPTIAKFLTGLGYNTRACGTSEEYALIPITEALLMWCEEIHVVKEQLHVIEALISDLSLDRDVYIYDIPDHFGTFDPELEVLVKEQFEKVS